VAKENGGYIYHSDHSVPSNVRFQQYQRVMGLVREHGAHSRVRGPVNEPPTPLSMSSVPAFAKGPQNIAQ
jgi:hypothetical protein